MCNALGQDVILDLALYKFGIFIYLFILYAMGLHANFNIQPLFLCWKHVTAERWTSCVSYGARWNNNSTITMLTVQWRAQILFWLYTSLHKTEIISTKTCMIALIMPLNARCDTRLGINFVNAEFHFNSHLLASFCCSYMYFKFYTSTGVFMLVYKWQKLHTSTAVLENIKIISQGL